MDNINYVIFKVLSNEATVREKEQFDQWLNADIANQAEFSKLESYWKSRVEYTHGIQADAAFDRFKKTKLTPVRTYNRTIKRIFLGVITTAAAAVLLLFTMDQPSVKTVNNFAFATSDQKDTLYLPDSTQVVLNKFSRVKYTSEYNRTERGIQLVGEAYFNVRKNAKVPFIVKMEKCQITVLGTAFNVSAYTNDKFVKATLIHGVIRFDINKDENGNQITLRPNQELKFNKLTDDIIIKNVNASSSLEWMNNLHRYESKSLQSLLNDLEVIYNKQIILSDKTLAKTVISGTFHSEQSLDEILNIISRSIPIKWEIDRDTIKITSN